MSEINLEIFAKLAIQYLPFLFALCFHEYAHGWMARRKGDNTAEMMGRLTMNPFAHADLIGTFVLPIAGILAGLGGLNGGQGFIFGWAKPVPVNSRNLKHPKEDMFWIAFAGPLSNILLGFIGMTAYILVRAFVHNIEWVETLGPILSNFVLINILLAVFNLIPLHPLDGGKVIARFLPVNWNFFLEKHQSTLQILLIMFFVVGGFRYLAVPMDFMMRGMFSVVTTVLSPIL